MGPTSGDRLFDWTGAYNLYVHCNAAYGGYNDQRTRARRCSRSWRTWRSASASVRASATCNRLIVGVSRAGDGVQPDVKDNTGSAYPTTPGHFDQPAACAND